MDSENSDYYGDDQMSQVASSLSESAEIDGPSTTSGTQSSSEHSPIAPRFIKETQRGVKRHLDLGRYRAEANRKKLVKPAGMTDEQLQLVDGYLFQHVKCTIAPRFHLLTKTNIKDCMTDLVPRKPGGQIPRNCTMRMVSHVADVLCDDYYKYYKNIVNKLRYDIRTVMEQVEPFFFVHPKGREKNVRGRDRWQWYRDTNTEAQILEQVVNGGTSKGFRVRLLEKYNGFLAVNDQIEANITTDQLKSCARHPFFYLVCLMSKEKTDLFDITKGLEGLDDAVRPSVEAMVIHVLYCDLWDVGSDDPVAWSRQTFRNLVGFVERDRQAVRGETNLHTFRRILQRVRPHLTCLPNTNEGELDQNGATDAGSLGSSTTTSTGDHRDWI